ncbi:hypothetical protein F4604DRAFT_1587019 [Suillus subluteus]|nr:hypothetical protein F4604DRAFT_1587019 [Suillus subluteus]
MNNYNLLPRLKAHLLGRLKGNDYAGEEPIFTLHEIDEIGFQYNHVYNHATTSINYTTYNVQRDQDTIHIHSNNALDQSAIMLASHKTTDGDDGGVSPHPYWYAWVLGIHHVMVEHPSIHKAT